LFAHLDQVARRMQHGPDLTSRALAAVNATIVDMVAAVLEEQPAKRDGETAMVSRAKAFIDDHLRDPGLTPARVAAALNVSLRTLYRSFDADGQTIAAYIRRSRLLRTRRDLAAMKTTGNIYGVAQRWGFADKSHFAKLFLREFGCLPSEYVRNL
jgi:AraC-like DNA-binding protein